MLRQVSVVAFVAFVGFGAQAGPTRLPSTGIVHFVHEGHAGATQATGTIDAVDPAQRKIKVSHGVIKSLGWPAMTTDFAVNKAVDLTTVKAGTRVNFSLVRDASGAWIVDSLKPQ